MSRARIVVADLPRMLSDILGRIVMSQPDLELVGRAAGRMELLDLLDRLDVDVAVVGGDESELPDLAMELFRRNPRMPIVGVAADGRRAFVYRLRPHCEPIGEVSPRRLLRAIREAAAGRRMAARARR